MAGLFMFLAPCTLPLVPAFLGFISGISAEDLKDPEKASQAKRKIILNGLFFVIGFSAIFIVFGSLAGLLGQALVPFRIWLGRIGGLLVIIFGLFMLDVLKLSIFKSGTNLKVPSFLTIGKPSSSLLIGGAFAFGWTPCVGPILGTILLLATNSATALQGAFLLFIFSLGLAIPFMLISIGFASATSYIEKITKYLNIISKIGGVFLIVLGLLLVTDNFGLTIQIGYDLLEFLNYEEFILDFL